MKMLAEHCSKLQTLMRTTPCLAVSPDIPPTKLIVYSPVKTTSPTEIFIAFPETTFSRCDCSARQGPSLLPVSQQEEHGKNNIEWAPNLSSVAETEESDNKGSKYDMTAPSVSQAVESSSQNTTRSNVYDFETNEEFLTMDQIFKNILSTRPRRRLRNMQKKVYERQYIDRNSLGGALLRASRGFNLSHHGTALRR